MTIQPTFGFTRNAGGEAVVDDADQQCEEIGNDEEKKPYPTAEGTPSVSSVNSDEKQTFGVSKVEAITTVWTKRALITLYVLFYPPSIVMADLKYFPCLFRQFNATTDHGTISAICYECIQFTFSHSCYWNCLQHHNGRNETPPRQNSRCFRSI